MDAFTDRPFGGNPAGVCLLPEPREERWMQAVAGEMNLSETAFLVQRKDGGFDLRWFTPVVEVELCGHATLASAHVLWEEQILPRSAPARFHTRSGLLSAVADGDWITLDMPAEPALPVEAPPGLVEALGVAPSVVARNRFDYLVHLTSEAAVRGLQPDVQRLRPIAPRGVIVTAESADPGYDFVSRFFAPAAGIDEDPVTGSAHCCLGPFWHGRLGRATLTGFQASARGGLVRVTVDGDRVRLAGQAVTVFTATLHDRAVTGR